MARNFCAKYCSVVRRRDRGTLPTSTEKFLGAPLILDTGITQYLQPRNIGFSLIFLIIFCCISFYRRTICTKVGNRGTGNSFNTAVYGSAECFQIFFSSLYGLMGGQQQAQPTNRVTESFGPGNAIQQPAAPQVCTIIGQSNSNQ